MSEIELLIYYYSESGDYMTGLGRNGQSNGLDTRMGLCGPMYGK